MLSFTVCLLGLSTLLKAAPAPSAFTFYDMPTPLAGPCDLCEGPDGAEWVQDILANKIARIDPSTGTVEEFEIPFTLPPNTNATLPNLLGRTVLACAIMPGKDGHLYAANGLRNQLVRINVTTKVVDVFTPPPFSLLGDLQPFNDLYAGPTGMYFTQTTANVISHFGYSTHVFTNYEVPTPEGSPLGMFFASDGGAWFSELLGNKIGRLDPGTGTIKEYEVPQLLSGPAVIRVETENRYIWITLFLGNGLARLEMATGEIKIYPNTTPLSFPAEDTLDTNRNQIWFSTATQNTLNMLDPTTGKISTVTQPGTVVAAPVSLPFYFDIGIHYGPGDAIWFTEATTNRVGRYALS